MHYFGGKFRVGKHIAEYINSYSNQYNTYWEPFCGGCWVTKDISFKYKYVSDNNKYLIALYNALQQEWIPPDKITKEDYKKAKSLELDDALTGFIGIGCSFSGKWFGGFARDNTERNYALNAKRSLLKKIKTMQDVVFASTDYKTLGMSDSVVYCDPPYKGMTNGYITNIFNHDEFWDIMRKWSKNNKVIVSEYSAPDDFKCVVEFKTKTDIRNKNNKQSKRVEKLYEWRY